MRACYSPLQDRSDKTENTFLYYHYRLAVHGPGTKFVRHSSITPSDVTGANRLGNQRKCQIRKSIRNYGTTAFQNL